LSGLFDQFQAFPVDAGKEYGIGKSVGHGENIKK
jgi:hypothetical protein